MVIHWIMVIQVGWIMVIHPWITVIHPWIMVIHANCINLAVSMV